MPFVDAQPVLDAIEASNKIKRETMNDFTFSKEK